MKDFDESKHPRDRDGKFTGENGTYRQNASYDEIVTEYERKNAQYNPEFLEFIQKAKRGELKSTEEYVIAPVSGRERDDIERLTGQRVSATKHVIRADELRHIEKRHGEAGSADHSMENLEDVALIENVLQNYDHMSLVRNKNNEPKRSGVFRDDTGTHAKMVRYTKEGRSGRYVIEALPDNKSGNLYVVSAYRTKE